MDAGRAFVLVANKWDLVEDKDRSLQELAETVRPFANATVMRTSADDRTWRAPSRHRSCSTSTRGGRRSDSTSKVNEVIQQAQRERAHPARRRHPPLRDAGRHRTTVVRDLRWCRPNRTPTYQRYLENRLRRTFDLDGVPIRLRFRPRKRTQRRSAERSAVRATGTIDLVRAVAQLG